MLNLKSFFFVIAIVLSSNLFYSNAQVRASADSTIYDELVYGKDINVLIGHVKIIHKTAVMYCDTAFQNKKENRIKAVGSIHIIQNDTTHLYGKRLNYDGNTGLAEVRDDVKLVNNDVILTTDYLDYDRVNNFAYYFNNGKIVNKENTLTSKEGFYYPNTNKVFYKDSVVAVNPKYTIYSDTLIYNTISKISNIEGATYIVSDSNIIYSESGYYDMLNDVALLKYNAYIQGKQTLKGDTIYYERAKGFGEVFNHMELIDTTNNVVIAGDYGFYNEQTKEALATKNAILMQIYKQDTLFMHADTLHAIPIKDTEDKLIKAFHKVSYYREDLQGRCDSMVYDTRDSTNTFYHDPIMWSSGNQLTADVMKMYTQNNVLKKIELKDRAFIISQEDSVSFNQIKGKLMTGYVRDNHIYKIDVDGNAQSIYFPKDRKNVMGVNKAECSNMTIFLKNNTQIDRIIMRVSPTGTMNPPYLLPDEDVKLKGFYWLDVFRPKNKDEIFIWKELPEIDRGQDRSDYELDDTYEKTE